MVSVMKIGITGTIASGKTTVGYLLRRRRLPVFDCDGYVRICYQKNHPAFLQIAGLFPGNVLDDSGEINRQKVAGYVFSDEDLRQKLNDVIHPYVKEGLLRFMENHAADELVFAEVPLLFEAGWDSLFDVCCVVTCSEETAVKRMIEDRGYTEDQALERIRSQMPGEEKCRLAEFVIQNEGSIKELDIIVSRWVADLRKEVRDGTQRS